MATLNTPVYNPKMAWRRAFLYFAICWLIAIFSGALTALLSRSVVTAAQANNSTWWAYTIICGLIILVGYGFIWPRGTLTHGRPLNWAAIGPFGSLWGISEGLLFVSVWFLVKGFVTANWLVILLTFAILSTFVGLWHALYWDIYVAPEHNIEEWNLRKVLLAHIPNLAMTLIYLTLFGNMVIFVMFQAIALFLSTYFMRFPAPTYHS